VWQGESIGKREHREDEKGRQLARSVPGGWREERMEGKGRGRGGLDDEGEFL
jgi:hypothetical protein